MNSPFQLLNLLLWLLLAFAAGMVSAAFLHKRLGFSFWVAGLIVLLLSLFLYFTNVFLVRYFIKTRAPAFANDELWQHTAGMGIVPKWVSLVGVLAFPVFFAAVFWIVFMLFFGY